MMDLVAVRDGEASKVVYILLVLGMKECYLVIRLITELELARTFNNSESTETSYTLLAHN